MATQQDLDNAGIDAIALTSFITSPAGTQNVNSQGNDIGTLADISFSGGAQFADVEGVVADTQAHAVGTMLVAQRESATYQVVDNNTPAQLVTAGGTRLVHIEGPYVIVITGQSNAAGSNSDGPNPASPLVEIWDGVTDDWGSSDRTLAPLNRSTPHGNIGNNNYALGRAHRIVRDTGRPVRIIYDALGGQEIAQWVGNGTDSTRYAAIAGKVISALASPILSAANKTVVDEIIVAQGEADFNDDFATYLGKIEQLRNQLRAETWCGFETPIYMMSPSDLHDRYQWRDALVYLCTQKDNRCIFVTSNGLRTEFGLTGSGDYTHFTGESLWEAGFHRIADAGPTEGTPTCFYGRGTGPVDATDATAMTTFSTIVSRDSWTTEVPPNGPAATGSMSWGFNCAAEGNYTFALGYDCTTHNLANYGLVAGRANAADQSADYFGCFGYQNTLSARYTLASGRGNTVADEGGTSIGMFTEYTAAQTDPVMFQVGTGVSSSTRSNGLSVRKSGVVEMKNLPVFADNADAVSNGAEAGTLYRNNGGGLRIVV
ncbi:hypothetical protein SAMN04488515_3083 [Cognatiyoonia koreensis]|uniref:Sialate O-acetylesterase domain-containing protein n=1 Tax=Cognatiyoonia koreensis TaxID=364200 RepID=A0A1I0RQE2_9RHOB|nr:sialate O-acetylesterase [Cognatiyoonia koreensis]SEW43455.1 hypothetical protein SAMN04488515_3083 [Cognatiyoonia koreensis]